MALIEISRKKPKRGHNRVRVIQGGTITFKSNDDKYFVTFDSDNTIISSNLPANGELEIPANDTATLNINSNATKQGYKYRILDKDKKQCWPKIKTRGVGNVPPEVIVD